MDGVALSIADCARDYGQFAEAIGLERRNIADLQDAKNHPDFKKAHHDLLDRLAREYRASRPLLERAPRFTVKLGVYGTKENMIASVKGNGHKFSDYALSVIANDQYTMLDTLEEYDFFESTIQELTGKKNPTTTEVFAAQYRLGFIDAPFESAPAIREVYTDQPMGEWRAVLSKPVADSGGYLRVLSVERSSGGSWVDRRYADPGDQWDGDIRLLLCRKRLAV